MPNLDSLPQELLILIQFFSLSPSLPIVSKTLFAQLYHPPPTQAARYLLAIHGPPSSSSTASSRPPKDLLLRCLRHGICTLPVVHALERLFPLLYPNPPPPPSEPSSPSSSPQPTPPPPVPPPRMYLFELPKRLFRSAHLPPPTLLPLLDHLFTRYFPDPSSHKGFPLCASVLQHPASIELTRYLLQKGADPGANDGYAVRIAAGKKDLALVRLLIEVEEGTEGATVGGKRRRVQDRVTVTNQMLNYAVKYKAMEVIEYFVNEKGAKPDMKTLIALDRL
ncbi:hypothetical protein BDY24DRAFT_384167 [Mrakia frigida]|uniref:uncharacterized protein n=1 Tax=Mrakia frigida TaxID=29902 RepID=UPI003FCC009E